MALVSNAIPNLVGGVSQQPPALRTSSSCSAMVNAWPSIVSGLMKRQSTEWVKKLNIAVDKSAIVYSIDRDNSYRYLVLITRTSTAPFVAIKVLDMDGNEQTVTTPSGIAYLAQASSPIDSFRFLTVGDTTFILNREVTVRGRNYGEAGEASSFTPTGTVENLSDLPTAAAGNLNAVYFVSTESDYYKCVMIPAVPSKSEWTMTVNWQDTIPTGYTRSSANPNLPSTPVVNAKVYITRTISETGSNGKKNTKTQYAGYTGTATAAIPASYKWEETALSKITAVNTTRIDPDEVATVHVTNSVPNANYAIYINNVLKASFTTSNNMSGDNAVQSTTSIAQSLLTDLTTAGYTAYRYGSTVSIRGLTASDRVVATTTNGDKSLKAYRSEIKSFSDLPPNEAVGRVVKVKGDPSDQRDDYYVVYTTKGEWDETVGFNQGAAMRDETMPHILVRQADGSFVFKPHTWDNRNAGDFDSNPFPSFVGCKINDIFTYSNRLGFVADENVILSETDQYENFFRTTLAQLLDSDPIDYAVLHNNVNILSHAVAFDKDLILFSDHNQFRFSYNNFLNHKNVQIKYTTSFNCAKRPRPVNMGASLYFVDDVSTSRYAKLWEYFPQDNAFVDNAEDATAQVPEYIPSGVRFFNGSTRVKSMVVGTEGDQASLFVYKYFWNGDNKVQSAWGKWTFTDVEIVFWAGFINNYMYLLVKRSDGISLERMKFDEDVFTSPTDYDLLIDRRYTIPSNTTLYDPFVSGTVTGTGWSVAYNASTKTSTITIPYSTTATIEVISFKPPVEDGVNDSVRNAVTRINGTTVSCPGDLRGQQLVIGIPYTFSYEFSTPYLKSSKGSTPGVTILDGRLQMRYMSLEYHNTAFFRTRVRLPGRPDYVNTFNGRVIGSAQTILGQATFLTGTFRMPLMGKNTDLRFWLENDSPFPSTFGSAEWQAMYTPRSAIRT